MPKNTDNNAPKILDSDSIIKHHGQSITKIHNAQQLLGTYASTNFCGPRTDQRNRKPNGSLNRILVPITSDLSPRLVKTQALSSLTGPSRFELIGSSEIRTTATPGSKPQIRTIKIEIKKNPQHTKRFRSRPSPPRFACTEATGARSRGDSARSPDPSRFEPKQAPPAETTTLRKRESSGTECGSPDRAAAASAPRRRPSAGWIEDFKNEPKNLCLSLSLSLSRAKEVAAARRVERDGNGRGGKGTGGGRGV